MMTLLEILEKGLSVREQCRPTQRCSYRTAGYWGEISDEDSAWLDNTANLVKEQFLVVQLQESSDFEHTLLNLDPKDISLLEKLKALAGPRAAAMAKVTINNKWMFSRISGLS
jgi:hypothetical protein